MCGINAVINGKPGDALRMAEATQGRGWYIQEYHHEVNGQTFDVAFNYLPITGKSNISYPFSIGTYRFWLNGYISNYKELQRSYNVENESGTDTEVMARLLSIGIQKEKIDDYLNVLNGFFSILIYDESTGKSSTYTDRHAIKQLYVCENAISSEIKGLQALYDIKEIRNAINNWRSTLGIINKWSGYYGVWKVNPVPHNEVNLDCGITYHEAKLKLSALLLQAFERNKAPGLRTGVLLSGGIDSGMLAKYMQPDYCFSMDYEEKDYSEIQNIKRNTQGIHYTMICNKQLADTYAPLAAQCLDELKAGSCYTNYALTELASKFCKVLYSGAGGDELFKGYTHRYDKPVVEVAHRSGCTPGSHLPMIGYEDMTHQEYDAAYLKGILIVEDRIGGAHAVETRYPFLDNDLWDFVRSLPRCKEFLTDKRILKAVCGLHPDVVNGKKRGFSNPHFTNLEWADYVLTQKGIKP
jgi:asparagine synthase (glutamine-hydrolysing)